MSFCLTHSVHESGHALACVAQGNTVTNWPDLYFTADAPTQCEPDSTVNIVTTVAGPALPTYGLDTHQPLADGVVYPLDHCTHHRSNDNVARRGRILADLDTVERQRTNLIYAPCQPPRPD
jgi:hypothetical protein